MVPSLSFGAVLGSKSAKPSAADLASAFASACRSLGWAWQIKDETCIAITKAFPVGDLAAFAVADGEAGGLISLAPLKGGSVWGTDGGSCGGHSAVVRGRYWLNKSGNGKRFLAALAKISGGVVPMARHSIL